MEETPEGVADVLRTGPAVLKGRLEGWPSRHWTARFLADVVPDKKVKMRIGPVSAARSTSVLWETDCMYEEATLKQFCEWLDGPDPSDTDNPLLKYSQDEYWCYVDYKQMAFLFEEHPDILEAVDWSDFGCPGRDGRQSTIWIGSRGAFTPGHFDTYGFNLVAQIYGRKRWHLFPPGQSRCLYPTRLPYEESSVFSPVNLARPSLRRYPRLAGATPYVVTLEPGDVLFVPKHWWHFVESLEVSISVNTWVEVESDKESRLEEAVTRAIVSAMMPRHGDIRNWVNPTETICDEEMNYGYVRLALEDLFRHFSGTPGDAAEGAPSESDNETAEGAPVKTPARSDPDRGTSGRASSSPVLPRPPHDRGSDQSSGSLQARAGAGPSRADQEGIAPASGQLKRPTPDGEGQTPTPQKLPRSDPCLLGGEESKAVLYVPCQGQIYGTTDQSHPSCGDESSDADLHMRLRSKVGDLSTDDLRRMLIDCATHPSVVSLMTTLLKEKLDQRH